MPVPNHDRRKILELETALITLIAPHHPTHALSALGATAADTITAYYGVSDAAVACLRAYSVYFESLAAKMEKNGKIVKTLNPAE